MSSVMVLTAAAALVVAAGGCKSNGSYQATWSFGPAVAGTTDATEAAAGGCSAHGVFGIRVTGASATGDREDVTTLCTSGQLAHSVAPGTWTLVVHGLDANGAFKVSADSPILNATVSDVIIPEGDPPAVVSVVLMPQPACGDGVDNDHDGRVDLDDPDCAGDPAGASERGQDPMPPSSP